jgi:hypothetical protein
VNIKFIVLSLKLTAPQNSKSSHLRHAKIRSLLHIESISITSISVFGGRRMMAQRFLTLSFAMLVSATTLRSIPQDICRPPTCPDPNGPSLFGEAILEAAKCGPNGLIECGITQYPSMTYCACPDDLLCVEQGTQQLWSERSQFRGTCVGRLCNEKPDTPKSQRQCHSTQICVHKIVGLNPGPDGKQKGSQKGRCLSKVCSEGVSPGPCPSGWSCIKDIYDPEGRGLCSHDSFQW